MTEAFAALEHNIEKQLTTHKSNENREEKPPELERNVVREKKPNKL